MTKPLVIDLFCGLGGFTEGFVAEGWDAIGFDIERHIYGEHRYPAHLVLQDVRTIHGKQFREASLIVASSPCQKYSYMAMPWSRAKAQAEWLDPGRRFRNGGEAEFPERIAELNALFDAPRRIQREACEAAGRYIPMIQENVKGAQPWVGRAAWSFGSYFLWGDVPVLMPPTGRGTKVPKFRFDGAGGSFQTASVNHTQHATKNTGGSWLNVAHNTISQHGSKSLARKAASARIAMIPEQLSRHIARVFYPR